MKVSLQEVWTLAEVRAGKIHPVSLELLAWGRQLADDLQVPLASVLMGHGLADQASSLIPWGADKVYLVDRPELAEFHGDAQTKVLAELIERENPQILIASATTQGRTVMPLLYAALGCGLTADCTSLAIDPETKRLIQTRPAIGGNIMADIRTKGRDPQMCTVRPKSRRPLEPHWDRVGEVISCSVQEGALSSLVQVLGFEKAQTVGLPIQEAEIIVAGGKGMKGAKNFGLLEELAGLLGGSLGASRAAVDLGWAPYSAQVGLSGKSVTPRLYLAFGISGAVQHLAGMSGAGTVVAVNSDPEAPIFNVADFAVQGDATEVARGLIQALKARAETGKERNR